jgi:Glyoxalase-like domain
MHRSRLFGLFIDTPTGEAPAAVAFWAAALGATPREIPDEPEFTALAGAVPGLAVEVQAVGDPPRYHLDIETDDVDAELARLLALGAVVETPHDGWSVLRAPGGHLVCVVPVQSDPEVFAAQAHDWA